MNRFLIILSLLIPAAIAFDCDVSDHNTETKIKKALFCDSYDSSLRPVKDHKTTTIVSVKMMVKSYDFNDHYSTLTVNAWMVNRWKDEFLTWDPLVYDNVNSIDVPSSQIWRPDFSLYNADISYGIGSCHETSCLIQSTGNVTCIEPCSYTAHCSAKYDLWPYDKQNCSMFFGPWMSNTNEVDYKSESTIVTVSGSAQDTQWKLLSARCTKRTYSVTSKDMTSEIPNLIFSFQIERHSALITKLIGASCAIFICINVLASFIDCLLQERISLLAMNILLHFQMIHQVSWTLPHGGESLPRTLGFYKNSLIITCFLLLESLLVKSLCQCESQPPNWIQGLLSFISNHNFDFMLFDSTNHSENDENNLIEGKPTEFSKENRMWRNFASIVDKLLVLLVAITYAIMTLVMIPFHYGKYEELIEQIK